MNSLTEENYLKALFNLAGEKGEVGVGDLSQHLDIKMPTVTNMMKRLAEKKLVHYETYKPVRLTERGRKEAALIIRKHRLTEMYLVQKMGFGWEDVHEIAEQIEHIQSPAFFDKMDQVLGYPKADPHGAPIPDKNGKLAWIAYDRLCDCRPGDSVRLAAVVHSSSDFLKFLNHRQIHLGLRIKVRTVESFDGSLVVAYENREETLSRIVCERLLVEKGK
jgi:DtxR family Mn-dependent transcriptional regulator